MEACGSSRAPPRRRTRRCWRRCWSGSVDLSRHPYRLRDRQAPYRLADALRAKAADAPGEARAPFPATAGVLAALTGLPAERYRGCGWSTPATST